VPANRLRRRVAKQPLRRSIPCHDLAFNVDSEGCISSEFSQVSGLKRIIRIYGTDIQKPS
jgi:hypothetical protein